MAGQHVFGFKHAVGAEVHDGLYAVADPLPPDADAGAVAALAFAPPLPVNADRVRNVVGQRDQFERADEEDAELVPGAGLGASAVHPLGGVAGHDAERSRELGAEGVKEHVGFKASDKAEGEKTAEGAKEAEAADGSVVDQFEREVTEGAASVPGAGLGASGVHPLGGGTGHDAERSHDLDAEGFKNKEHVGFKSSQKAERENTLRARRRWRPQPTLWARA